MKKFAKTSVMLAAIVFAFLFTGCSGGDDDSNNCSGSGASSSGQIPDVLVKIPTASIDGTETWTPESEVFVSGDASWKSPRST